MATYSEATRRVFERSLILLEGKLPTETIEAIRLLIENGEFTDLDKIEKLLRETGGR